MRLIASYLPSVLLLPSEYFVVMNNFMLPMEGCAYQIEEKYDLKGSVIGRHGKVKSRDDDDDDDDQRRRTGRVGALQ